MPLSDEQKKINKAISNKKYREENKELIAAKSKIYNETNKEVNKKQKKLYRESDQGRKNYMLSNWSRIGLKGNYEKIYEYYLKTEHCQECECVFGKRGHGTGTFKCMDHHHATGLFRNVLCNACNIRRK